MKKILLSFYLILASLITFAQIPSIGIKGGFNLATTVNNEGGGNFTPGPVSTFNAGICVDLRFGNFSLQPGLNYIGEGQRYALSDIVPVTSNGTATGGDYYATDHLYYLQLPVNLVFHIPVLIGNIYFGAGPYAAEGLSGKTTYSNNDASQKINFGNSGDDDVRPTQFGAEAIVGFKLKGGLFINANYDFGLSNDLPSADTGSSRRSRVFGISLGYAYL